MLHDRSISYVWEQAPGTGAVHISIYLPGKGIRNRLKGVGNKSLLTPKDVECVCGPRYELS